MLCGEQIDHFVSQPLPGSGLFSLYKITFPISDQSVSIPFHTINVVRTGMICNLALLQNHISDIQVPVSNFNLIADVIARGSSSNYIPKFSVPFPPHES